MAYAGDLKSLVLNGTCGFDSHPGHQLFPVDNQMPPMPTLPFGGLQADSGHGFVLIESIGTQGTRSEPK